MASSRVQRFSNRLEHHGAPAKVSFLAAEAAREHPDRLDAGAPRGLAVPGGVPDHHRAAAARLLQRRQHQVGLGLGANVTLYDNVSSQHRLVTEHLRSKTAACAGPCRSSADVVMTTSARAKRYLATSAASSTPVRALYSLLPRTSLSAFAVAEFAIAMREGRASSPPVMLAIAMRE